MYIYIHTYIHTYTSDVCGPALGIGLVLSCRSHLKQSVNLLSRL